MPRGDLVVFNAVGEQVGNGEHDFSSDSFHLGIVNGDTVPLVDQAVPSWNNFLANEVSDGGGYVAGGIPLANLTFTRAAAISTLNADDIALAQDPLGFTNGFYGIIFNNTSVGKVAIAFVDLAGPVSEVDSPIEFNWNALGIYTHTVVNA